MTWRQKLIPAKFRDVEFKILTSGYNIGRRTAVHQFPFQDVPFVEDIGGAADGYSITGYILQEAPDYNYFEQRDKLIAALKAKGPGQLNHPYLGKKLVSLQGQAQVNETIQEGGIARFSMNFVESGTKKFPQTGDTLGPLAVEVDLNAVDVTAFNSSNAAGNVFAENVDTSKLSVADILAGMQAIQSSLNRLKSLPSGVISSAIAIISQATNLVNSVLGSPCALFQAIAGGYASLQFAAGMLEDQFERGITERCADTSGGVSSSTTGTSARSPITAADLRDPETLTSAESIAIIGAALEIADYGKTQGQIESIVINSKGSAQRAASQKYLINLIRINGLTNAIMVAVRALYNGYEESNAQYIKITNALDEFIDYLGDEANDSTLANQGVSYNNDETYQAAKELKPMFTNAMVALGNTLARSRDYDVTPDSDNILTLAYEQYEDLSRSESIIQRNPLLITHPGFLPGGKTIDILTF